MAVRAVTAEVADYNRAFEDQELFAKMREDFASQVRPMLDLGVDVVVPAGGYPMLLFGRDPSFTVDEATVLNGLPVVLAAAEVAVRLRDRHGISTSRRGAYALPPKEAVEEFRSEI